MAQQKNSRGNGSNLEESLAIVRDVLTGSLAIREMPGFIAWMLKKGGAV